MQAGNQLAGRTCEARHKNVLKRKVAQRRTQCAYAHARSHSGSEECDKVRRTGHTLEKGASVDIQNKDGFTALILASRNWHREVVGKLLEKGASVDIQDKDGFTALTDAGERSLCEAIFVLSTGEHSI